MQRPRPAHRAGAAQLEDLADPTFSDAVIGWQKRHGRHMLPWQNTRDAYLIWLSEIMLQQTQVSAVVAYYARFLARFPTLIALAAAPLDDVMALWSGLGYYSRARNLHRCAQIVVAEYDAVFPVDPAKLAQLPGIGRSTAAAIAAFSCGTRAAILDGNVKRVFARVFGIEAYPGIKSVEDGLWRRAAVLLPQHGIEAYTQGLMDLGALLCKRSSPDCQSCPLQQRCVAFATDRVRDLPVRKPNKTRPEKHTTMLVIVHRGQVLLERRPGSGIWGGLLSLPELNRHAGGAPAAPSPAALNLAVCEFGAIASQQRLAPFMHTFTHYRLHIAPYRITLERRFELGAQSGRIWYDGAKIGAAALPAPVKTLLLELFGGAPPPAPDPAGMKAPPSGRQAGTRRRP